MTAVTHRKKGEELRGARQAEAAISVPGLRKVRIDLLVDRTQDSFYFVFLNKI